MTRTTRAWAAAGLGVALALTTPACGGDESTPKPPVKAEKPTPTPTPTPEPAAELVGDANLGAAVYANNCATCHGAKGDGDGPLSNNLPARPAKHSDGNYMNPLTDSYLIQVVTEGGPAVGKDVMMAAWGSTLTPQEIANVVAHVRTLVKAP